MKIHEKLLNKPMGDVLEAFNDPAKQKELTFGELMQVVSVVETAANASVKLRNAQNGSFDYDVELKRLEKRIRILEDKLDSICSAFTGGDYCD